MQERFPNGAATRESRSDDANIEYGCVLYFSKTALSISAVPDLPTSPLVNPICDRAPRPQDCSSPITRSPHLASNVEGSIYPCLPSLELTLKINAPLWFTGCSVVGAGRWRDLFMYYGSVDTFGPDSGNSARGWDESRQGKKGGWCCWRPTELLNSYFYAGPRYYG